MVESLSKLAAVGADPMQARLTFQEYFERLHDKPERWGKPAAALLGALTAQLNLGLPSIGGKDSMSGSFEDLDVPPTLVSFAVTMTTASGTVSGAFNTRATARCCCRFRRTRKPACRTGRRSRRSTATCSPLIEDGAIVSAHVVKEGGAAAAVAKMAFGNKMGFVFNTDAEDPALLFAPKAGALVVEVEQAELRDVTENLNCVVLGMINESGKIEIGCKALGVDDLIETWNGKLEKIFANKAETVAVEYDVPLQNEKYTGSPVIKTAKPKVFIPVFPGTNCEIDTKRAFEKAGAETEILVVQNLTAKDIEYTIDRMEKGDPLFTDHHDPGRLLRRRRARGLGQIHRDDVPQSEDRAGGYGSARIARRPDARYLQRLPGAHQARPCHLRKDCRSQRTTTRR